MTIVIATSNQGKLAEFQQMLKGFTLQSFAGQLPEETGTTYAANAILKAEAACAATGLPALGDDSGIEVALLDGRPGLYSARFNPHPRPGEPQDAANRRKLLEELQATKRPASEWHARFVCALAFASPGQPSQTFWGEVAGMVLPEARGTHGFGYDPIVYAPEFEQTFAELQAETKNRLSHRGQAVAAWLKTQKSPA